MKISIVTVCYNSADTIRHTIESVLNQNYGETEYIIIDGGSKDGTVDIIKEYSDRITYWCSEKDQGIYDAMNKGIRKSTGEVIAFMNSDDWYYSNNIFKNIALCFDRSNADIVYGDFIRMWSDEDKESTYFSVADKDPETLHFSFPFCHQAMFMRRRLFDVLGEYQLDYKVSADYEWILKAYINNFKFQYIPECICAWSYGGYTQKHLAQNIEECKKIRLNMLPEAKRELYYNKILQTYEKNQIGIIESMLISNDEYMLKIARESLKKYDNSIILCGAGIRGKRMKQALDNTGVNIITIMDNDIHKWGTSISGTKVEKPYFISNENIKVVITMKENNNEVKEQLLALGYRAENIFTKTEFWKELYRKIYTF